MEFETLRSFNNNYELLRSYSATCKSKTAVNDVLKSET